MNEMHINHVKVYICSTAHIFYQFLVHVYKFSDCIKMDMSQQYIFKSIIQPDSSGKAVHLLAQSLFVFELSSMSYLTMCTVNINVPNPNHLVISSGHNNVIYTWVEFTTVHKTRVRQQLIGKVICINLPNPEMKKYMQLLLYIVFVIIILPSLQLFLPYRNFSLIFNKQIFLLERQKKFSRKDPYHQTTNYLS